MVKRPRQVSTAGASDAAKPDVTGLTTSAGAVQKVLLAADSQRYLPTAAAAAAAANRQSCFRACKALQANLDRSIPYSPAEGHQQALGRPYNGPYQH